jgi:putative ATPase
VVPGEFDGPPTKKTRRNAAEEAAMPLAERMRPKTLEELIGHEDLVGKDGVLRELILTDRVPSMVLWAGPGVNASRSTLMVK